jgi:peptide/nickel transport system substrate-binding protein
MWTRIGVQTQVEALPWAAFSCPRARQEFAMRLGGWGSSTGEASNYLGPTSSRRMTGSG